MKKNIQIKSIYGNVLFEFEKENNTMKDTVEEAVKQKVNLSGADLRGADLQGADLRGANLHLAHLFGADLYEANLYGADLRYADLRKTNLCGANLQGAKLRGAILSGAENIPFIPLNCPAEGAFIAWKKVEEKLVQLEIPADARRSSATTNKCRCDKAKVLSITDLDEKNPIDEILNTAQVHELLYRVGEMVYPDSFDEDRWNECSHGIHFFVDKEDAINY